MIKLPDLGVGITFSLELESFVRENLDVLSVLLIEPQAFWFHTGVRNEEYKEHLNSMKKINSFPLNKIVHGVATPVGGSVPPDPLQIPLFVKMVKELRSPWASEHLSFNRVATESGAFNTGFLLPPLQSREGVRHSIRSIEQISKLLPVPFAVETGVNYLRNRSDELSDGEFVCRVVEGANCGLVLDLHNLWTNEMNGRQSIKDFLKQIPLERVWEIHLAGGYEEDGFWVDAHSGEIPHKLMELTGHLLPRFSNVHSIIFEIYPSFLYQIDHKIIREQLEILWKLWNKREPTIDVDCYRHSLDEEYYDNVNSNGDGHAPQDWENALGTLVVDRTTKNNNFVNELSTDPGVSVYRKLIGSFRGSMVVGALPLTSRLLIGKLGEQFRTLLSNYWTLFTPELFASDEALGFAHYLKKINLKITYLNDVLEFEEAVIHSRLTGNTLVFEYSYDIISVLKALNSRQLPPPLAPTQEFFKLQIRDGEITYRKICDEPQWPRVTEFIPGDERRLTRNWNH